jgi:hypothetical protein
LAAPHSAHRTSETGLDVAAFVQTLVQPEPSSQPSGCARSVAVSRENRTISIGPAFIAKMCSGMEVSRYYLPGDQFSAYAKGLVKGWVMPLKMLYELHELEGAFSVGFIFDEDVRAESEQSSE